MLKLNTVYFFPTSKWRKNKKKLHERTLDELNWMPAKPVWSSCIQRFCAALSRSLYFSELFWNSSRAGFDWVSHTLYSRRWTEKKKKQHQVNGETSNERVRGQRENKCVKFIDVRSCRAMALSYDPDSDHRFRNEQRIWKFEFSSSSSSPQQQHQMRRQSESLLYLKHRENRFFFRVIVISWSARPSVRYQRARRVLLFIFRLFLRSVFSSLTRSTTSSSSVGMRRKNKK